MPPTSQTRSEGICIRMASRISWRSSHLRSIASSLCAGRCELPCELNSKELCRAEVREISSDRSLVVLNDILAESASDEYENDHLDDLMHKTVVEAVDERRGTIPLDVWKRNQVGEGSKIQQGDQISGNYRGQIPQNLRHHIAEDNKFGNNIKERRLVNLSN